MLTLSERYLSFSLVWLVMETDWEEVDGEGEEEQILWLNSSSLGTTDTCGDDNGELEERKSVQPKLDR